MVISPTSLQSIQLTLSDEAGGLRNAASKSTATLGSDPNAELEREILDLMDAVPHGMLLPPSLQVFLWSVGLPSLIDDIGSSK